MSDAARRGVVLDRDGTLIDVVRDEETGVISVAFHPDQLRFLPGVLAGLSKLAAAGFALAIATNQPGAAKGQISRGAIERTNQALLEKLWRSGIPIESFSVCLHHPQGGPNGDPSLVESCECRKPKPGMLLGIVEELGLDPSQSYMIGDSRADVDAAHAAGLRSGLIFSRERCELCPLRGGPAGAPEFCAPNFEQLVDIILAQPSRA
jgi:D-glycero-D-manno-heptose 1,7-bisphosphate phosphatase